MTYYHDLVTQKSWEELTRLKTLLPFVLIGGWATYLYTKTLKSKDIDILVDYEQLAILEKHYQLVKNERLHKYEAVKGGVQIDIYTPFYSQIGIPIEDLQQQIQSTEGFNLLKPEYLMALKLFTLSQRGRSAKGHKDFLDLLALWQTFPAMQKEVRVVIKQHRLESALNNFHEFLGEVTQVPELRLSSHHYAKLKQRLVKGLLALNQKEF